MSLLLVITWGLLAPSRMGSARGLFPALMAPLWALRCSSIPGALSLGQAVCSEVDETQGGNGSPCTCDWFGLGDPPPLQVLILGDVVAKPETPVRAEHRQSSVQQWGGVGASRLLPTAYKFQCSSYLSGEGRVKGGTELKHQLPSPPYSRSWGQGDGEHSLVSPELLFEITI